MIRRIVNKIRRKLHPLPSPPAPTCYTEALQQAYLGGSVCGQSLAGKRVLVTGGGSGIGLAIARRMQVEGCQVVVTGRNEKKLQATGFEYLVLDQMQPELLEAQFAKYLATTTVDMVVNNAGVLTDADRSGRFRAISETDYRTTIDMNLKSTLLLSKCYLQYMPAGTIINISSICAFSKWMGFSPYGLSKSGIVGLTQSLAASYPDAQVVAVAPGTVATQMNSRTTGDGIDSECNILHRMGIPEEIAAIVALAASPVGRYLRGQVITASADEIMN